MRLVVGLGNPGPKHQNQRHNIGFMAADEIVRRHGLSAPRARFQGDVSEGEVAGEKILVLKPMTFMNESGRAVGEAVRFYKLAVEDVFVIYDELDLAAAKLRVKQGAAMPATTACAASTPIWATPTTGAYVWASAIRATRRA